MAVRQLIVGGLRLNFGLRNLNLICGVTSNIECLIMTKGSRLCHCFQIKKVEFLTQPFLFFGVCIAYPRGGGEHPRL